ncbi:hypothetical protein V6N13_005928 [Hibiscus sabdariffa]|uniref:Uncharacterized protein n=1 Tax=Hibiscus sabdariffa TaxID=183260 RepID=A0ABR2EPB6_9ROSI
MVVVNHTEKKVASILEKFESKVNSLLKSAIEGDIFLEGDMSYFEVKLIFLTVYCQQITFYHLLDSEEQLVRDHHVFGHIVEMKGLFEKVKHLDGNLPFE